MLNLLKKDLLLTRLLCMSYIFAGAINFESKRWFPLYTVYQVVCNMYMVLTAGAEIILEKGEVNDIVASMSAIVAGIMSLFKLLIFVTRTKEIRSILERLEMIYTKVLEDEDTRNVILEAEKFGRKVSLSVILILDLLFPIAAFIMAIIADVMTNFKEKHLLLKVWSPWSKDNTLLHLITNTWITCVSIACLSVNAAFFATELTVSLYSAAYIKLLENKLIKNGINNHEIYEQHKVVMQLISDYNSELSGQMYLEALISPLMPCGFTLAAMRGIQKRDINQSFHNGVRACLAFIPCTISCYCGQLIATQMESLHESTYMSNWYEEKPKTRKDLMIMMTKTTVPTTVNYRLFVKFDHILLSGVLQVIYSYFTLMLNLEEG